MSDYSPSAHPVTGRRMLLIMVTFFGVIIAVNATMVRFATSSFGGLVVENSYIASQQFEASRDMARAQPMAGWEIAVQSVAGAPLRLALTQDGRAVGDVALTARAQRPTHGRGTVDLIFSRSGEIYLAEKVLAAGLWDLTLADDGDQLRTVRIQIPEARK